MANLNPLGIDLTTGRLKRLTSSDTISTTTGGLAGREMLTGNRTYYVRTDGSDSNNGLTNNAGGAFLTIQKAVDTAAMLDSSIYNVTIQVADGTYDGLIVCKTMAGAGSITILGNSTTPGNVIITTSNAAAGSNIISNSSQTTYNLQYFTITSTSPNTFIGGIHSILGGRMEVTGVNFGTFSGASGRHINSEIQGYIRLTGNYTINGSAAQHMLSFAGYIANGAKTITVSGTPAFTLFAYATAISYMRINGLVFSGSATGTRYLVSENSIIYSGGVTLPGDVEGSVTQGGQYL